MRQVKNRLSSARVACRARRRRSTFAMLAVAAIGCAASSARSQTSTWTSDADGVWSDPTNWDAPPAAQSFLTFAGTSGAPDGSPTGGTVTATNDLPAGTQFGTGDFGTAIGFAGPDAFTLTGQPINVVGDILNSSSSGQTIALDLTFVGTTSRTGGFVVNAGDGGLKLNGVISTTSTFGTLTFKPAGGVVTLAGHGNNIPFVNVAAGSTVAITGTTTVGNASVAGRIDVGDGTNPVSFSANISSFTGTLNVANGAAVNVSSAGGTAVNVMSGGSIQAGALGAGGLPGSTFTLFEGGSAKTTGITSVSDGGTINMNGGTWETGLLEIETPKGQVSGFNLNGGTFRLTTQSAVKVGAFHDDGGHLNVNGGDFIATDTTIAIANVETTVGVLTINGSSTFTAGQMFIGRGTNTAAKVSKTTGLANVTGGIVTNAGDVQVGVWGFGTLAMSGGTWNNTIGSFTPGYPSIGTQSSGIGVADLSGTAVFNQNVSVSRFVVGDAGNGVLSVRDGGILNVNSATNATTPGSLDSDNAALTIGNSNVATSVGVVNVRTGGTINTRSVGSVGGAANGMLNLNGGVLRVSSARTTPGPFISDSIANVFVWTGGAVIDTNGIDSSISRPLAAPTGNGVASISAVTATGYSAAPLVRITGGGGSGATALAQIDASGTITGFLITNPGVGYTSAPTITLFGVDGTSSGVVATLNDGNTSGGFEKRGAGTLTLSGANTYTGTTTIKAGTLVLSPAATGPVLGSDTIAAPAGADIQAGALVLSYAGGASPAAGVGAILEAGFHEPTQFATGLLRSTTLAADRTLGWRDDADASQLTIACTRPGDADLNLHVDFADLLTLARHYRTADGGVWADGDFDYDGSIDFADLLLLAKSYGRSVDAQQSDALGAAFMSDFSLAQALAPEPTVLSAAGLGLFGVARRRRRGRRTTA